MSYDDSIIIISMVFFIYCDAVLVFAGTVRYIGKLDFDILDHVYVGVHLDLPGNGAASFTAAWKLFKKLTSM